MNSKCIWEFVGSDAEGTARHFLGHLQDFLRRNNLEILDAGVASESPLRWSTWCLCAPAVSALLTKSLRPRRVVEVP